MVNNNSNYQNNYIEVTLLTIISKHYNTRNSHTLSQWLNSVNKNILHNNNNMTATLGFVMHRTDWGGKILRYMNILC